MIKGGAPPLSVDLNTANNRITTGGYAYDFNGKPYGHAKPDHELRPGESHGVVHAQLRRWRLASYDYYGDQYWPPPWVFRKASAGDVNVYFSGKECDTPIYRGV